MHLGQISVALLNVFAQFAQVFCWLILRIPLLKP